MANQDFIGFPVDDGISCNVLYEDILELLGLKKVDLDPFAEEDLLSFNN